VIANVTDLCCFNKVIFLCVQIKVSRLVLVAEERYGTKPVVGFYCEGRVR